MLTIFIINECSLQMVARPYEAMLMHVHTTQQFNKDSFHYFKQFIYPGLTSGVTKS